LRAWDYCTPYRSVPVYTLMNEELSWSDANADCLAAGLHLASVHSAAENALLVTAAAGNSVWIGGTDAASEGTWGWSPINTPLRYTNWISGEPNNDWGNEDCMQVRLSGKWNDAHCYFKLKYVCERRAWTPAPVVDVFLDPNCAGKRRRITSADFLHSYAACGGTWDDGSTMALQPARKTWWGSFKVAAGYAVDTYGTCHGGSRREVGVTSAAGCVSPTYDFNHVKIRLPPSPPRIPLLPAPSADLLGSPVSRGALSQIGKRGAFSSGSGRRHAWDSRPTGRYRNLGSSRSFGACNTGQLRSLLIDASAWSGHAEPYGDCSL
jgi:hypothetical protein